MLNPEGNNDFGEWLQEMVNDAGLLRSDFYKLYVRKGGNASPASMYRWFQDVPPPADELITLVNTIDDHISRSAWLELGRRFAERQTKQTGKASGSKRTTKGTASPKVSYPTSTSLTSGKVA